MNKFVNLYGWDIPGKKDLEIKINKLRPEVAKAKTNSEECDKTYGELSSLSRKARGDYEKLQEEFDNLMKAYEKVLDINNTFTSLSLEDLGATRNNKPWSMANEYGINPVSANRVRLVIENYLNTNQAEDLDENGESTPKDISKGVTVLITDNTEVRYIDSNIGVMENIYEDDKESCDTTIEDQQNIEIINEENAIGFNLLKEAQTPISIAPGGICSAIAKYLCSKAKKKCFIYVSHVGFAYLDSLKDSNGNPFLKRNLSDGNFYFEDKYPVREIDGTILGDKEIIVGDLSVVRFFVLGVANRVKNDIGLCAILKRKIYKEIITLTSDSKEAYFYGLMDISDEFIASVKE